MVARRAARKALKMVMDEENLQILAAPLMLQGQEPRQDHGEKNGDPQPQMHFEDLLDISVEDQERQNCETRNGNPDKAFCIKGEGARNITEDIEEETFCPCRVKDMPRRKT